MEKSLISSLKEKLDIVGFLQKYVELKPAGKNFKARCPFHKEKTPSFMVSPDRQTWHCFGTCNEGGDIISFLMKYENIEFYDALKILAEKAGVEISAGGNRDFQSSAVLYQIMDDAKEFFKANLWKSREILDYLKARGLQGDTVKEFELGLAPSEYDTLTRYLLKKGYRIDDVVRVGLSFKTDRGTHWDRFRGRIMFPIFNHLGKPVAFTGRILPGNDNPNVGKYVNSPETPIFQKSKILYGFDKTKQDIKEAGFAVLVEGQMDFLMLWQDGVKNVAASSGTALTEDHLQALQRVTNELVYAFDADEAGHAAAEKAIDLAGAYDFSVKIAMIDGAKFKDPADVVKAQPGLMAQLVKDARPAMEYYFHRYLNGPLSDLSAKKQRVRIVLGKIKHFPSGIDRSHWIKELSAIVKIEEHILAEEMELLKVAPSLNPVSGTPEAVSRPAEAVQGKREKISERLLGIILHLKNDLALLGSHLQYFPESHLHIYEQLIAGEKKKDIPSSLDELLGAISLRFSFENQNSKPEDLQKEMRDLMRALKVEYLKEKRKEISELIRKLEQDGSEEALRDALKEFDFISKELQDITYN